MKVDNSLPLSFNRYHEYTRCYRVCQVYIDPLPEGNLLLKDFFFLRISRAHHYLSIYQAFVNCRKEF